MLRQVSITATDPVPQRRWEPKILPVIEIAGEGENLVLTTPIGEYKPNHLNPIYFSANPHESGMAYRWKRSDAGHGVLEQITPQEYAWEIMGES